MEPLITPHVREPNCFTLDFYLAHEGYDGLRKALAVPPDQVIEIVKASGLRGRGGAGFPTGMKWQFVDKKSAKPRYIACNADESEPGTFKDHLIMERNPHLLIEGCAIACYAIGSGPVVVRAILPFSHVLAELREPNTQRTHDAIARLATLVRYDHRGFGLSDRDVTNFDLDAFVLDLEAVVERLHLGRFVLLANGAASPLALRYVAANPGRVTHLILYPVRARRRDIVSGR